MKIEDGDLYRQIAPAELISKQQPETIDACGPLEHKTEVHANAKSDLID